jgi:hypothetical protein
VSDYREGHRRQLDTPRRPRIEPVTELFQLCSEVVTKQRFERFRKARAATLRINS